VKDEPSIWAASVVVASVMLLVVLGVLALAVLLSPIR
jgi:hypothetical protein